MGYSDESILWIFEEVNKIQPYQFFNREYFWKYEAARFGQDVSLVDNNLDRNICVALHLYENMTMNSSLAQVFQVFIDKHLRRSTAIDGSLFGMGRTPGNLPIELIADYLNDYQDMFYDIDYLMDTI